MIANHPQDSDRPQADAQMPILRVESLTKRFGGLVAVDSLSFSVSSGLITALIGPNGAGKSTAFNLMSGVIKPDAGRVYFLGRNVAGWSPNRVVSVGLGRTFQNVRLFENLSALENVIVGRYCRTRSGLIDALFWRGRHRGERRETIEQATVLLERMGIADYRFRMPGEMSYGIQRRVEIARALATEPRLLLLDEPTAGVHGQAVREMVALVEHLIDSGVSVLLIEHNMNVVMTVSHRVIVMNFGQKIAEGSPLEIRHDPRVIEAYLGSDT